VSDSSLESMRPPNGFSWLVKDRAHFSSAQNTQLLLVFLAWTELLAPAVVESPIPIRQKRYRDKTQDVLCSCAGFLLSANPISPKSNSFLVCSLGTGFFWTTPAVLAVFLRPCYKCSNNSFAWSELGENSLLCGIVR